MAETLWLFGAVILVAVVVSGAVTLIQAARRGVPASEQSLQAYIRQLEAERLELKATINALQTDIKYREKERELLRDERQELSFKVELLKLQVENLRRDLDQQNERASGIQATGSTLNIGRDAAGGDVVRS